MKSRELQAALVEMAVGRSASDIDQRTRKLRLLSSIRSGPRGLHSPDMNMAEAAYHVLSLVAARAVDVDETLRRLPQCVVVPHPEHLDFFPPNTTIATVLVLLMEPPHESGRIGNIEILESGELAWVTIKRADGRRARVFFSTDPEPFKEAIGGDLQRYEAIDETALGSRFVIGAASIRRLGAEVAASLPEDDDGTTQPTEGVAKADLVEAGA
jgi:hypothetical protein